MLPGGGMCIEVGVKGRSQVRHSATMCSLYIYDCIGVAIAKHDLKMNMSTLTINETPVKVYPAALCVPL